MVTGKMAVDKSNARVRDMFAKIAGKYDLLNHVLSLNIDKRWRRKTVELVPPDGDRPILDVCTGTGDLALAYHRAAGGKIRVVGADFCRPMLTIADRKRNKQGINGAVKFIEADAQALPFEADRFQIVSAAFGLRNVADTEKGLAEMVRVCAAGGRVAILEFSRPRVPPLSTLYQLYFRKILPRIGSVISKDNSAYEYLPESVGDFPDGEALRQKMETAGLRDTWYKPMTFGVATLYVGTK